MQELRAMALQAEALQLTVKKNGITLLSARDPEGFCRKIANAVAVKNKTLYFCPSPLYGYGLDVLENRLKESAPDSAILCIEADPELYGLWNKGTKKIHYTNICRPDKLCAFIRKEWGARAFRRIEMVKFTGGVQLHLELYNLLFDAIKQEIANEWSNALTLTKLGRLYIRNMLRNLSLVPRSNFIEELSFGDSPVLVLGAGPSLDETLDSLPSVRDFKIVCVDTCLGALKDRNIIPDIVVILESQHWNLRDFTGCKNWNVTFAFDLSALPQSASVLSGKLFLFFTAWTELAVFNRMKNANLLPESVPPLGSVGVAAMHIAHRLTTGKITFAGFDFSFTLDKTHARGTPGHKAKLNSHNRFGGLIGFEAFGYGVIREGNRYITPNMRNYKKLFDMEFQNKISCRDHRGTESVLRIDAEMILKEFIQGEIDRLTELRNILTSLNPRSPLPKTYSLLKECDYLWAHFPDYAGGVLPDCEDISFLNRVRIEIDYMLKILEGVES